MGDDSGASSLQRAARRRRGRGPWYAQDLGLQRQLTCQLDETVDYRGLVTARLSMTDKGRILEYVHTGLEVPARRDPVLVTVQFHENPSYDLYGHAPWDYPRVFADPGAESKHRMPDDALCLWYPDDPPERRWSANAGLVALFDIVRNHLYLEANWRATGGHAGGTWAGPEAPHGVEHEEGTR